MVAETRDIRGCAKRFTSLAYIGRTVTDKKWKEVKY